MRSKHWGRWVTGFSLVVLIAAGCGGDDGGDEDATDGTEAAQETTTSAAETTTTTEAVTTPGTPDCGETVPDCTGSVTPAEGLTDGQEIAIEAGGFDPGLTLGITQCADENDPDHGIEATGAEHCNLRGIGNVTADGDGNVTATFNVAAGAGMEANTEDGVTCDATHDCVVSVGELIPDPDAQRVTFRLTFA